jgi:hypothetical protein
MEDFCFCPAKPIPDGLVIPKRGVAYLDVPTADAGTVTHVVDRIGLQHYPSVRDFLEEVRRFGLSRRMPGNLDVGRLDPLRSRLLIVHDHAILLNYFTELLPALRGFMPFGTRRGPVNCPNRVRGHAAHSYAEHVLDTPPHICDAAWDFDADPAFVESGGALLAAYEVEDYVAKQGQRQEILRKMPSFSYWTFTRPNYVPEWEAGIIASFPCGQLAMVRDTDDPWYPAKLGRVREQGKIAVEEVDK